MKPQIIRIALLGHGTVGCCVRQILQDRARSLAQTIQQRSGRSVQLELSGILVYDPAKHDDLGGLVTSDPEELFQRDYDVLVELIGGIEPASELIRRALNSGKDVVSANKQALFVAQGELERLAQEQGVLLRYEAAVAGAIPILRSIRGLGSGKITRLEGIVNGSTNYILTRVAQGLSLEQALSEAADRGYLEADPTSDVEGYDAMYKLGIMAYLISDKYPKEQAILRQGILSIAPEDIAEAREQGQKYKLIAQADFESGRYSVQPQAIAKDHSFYGIDGALNAIRLWHEHAGQLVFQGAGAGGDATASAVIGDLIDVIVARVRRQR